MTAGSQSMPKNTPGNPVVKGSTTATHEERELRSRTAQRIPVRRVPCSMDRRPPCLSSSCPMPRHRMKSTMPSRPTCSPSTSSSARRWCPRPPGQGRPLPTASEVGETLGVELPCLDGTVPEMALLEGTADEVVVPTQQRRTVADLRLPHWPDLLEPAGDASSHPTELPRMDGCRSAERTLDGHKSSPCGRMVSGPPWPLPGKRERRRVSMKTQSTLAASSCASAPWPNRPSQPDHPAVRDGAIQHHAIANPTLGTMMVSASNRSIASR